MQRTREDHAAARCLPLATMRRRYKNATTAAEVPEIAAINTMLKILMPVFMNTEGGWQWLRPVRCLFASARESLLATDQGPGFRVREAGPRAFSAGRQKTVLACATDEQADRNRPGLCYLLFIEVIGGRETRAKDRSPSRPQATNPTARPAA